MFLLGAKLVGYIVIMGFYELFVCNQILDGSTFITLKLSIEALCVCFFLNFEVVFKLFIFSLSVNSFLSEFFTLLSKC